MYRKLHFPTVIKGCLVIVALIGAPMSNMPSVRATPGSTIEELVTSESQPILRGSNSLNGGCTGDNGRNVEVTISTVYQQGSQMITYSTANGQVDASSDGITWRWSLDFKKNRGLSTPGIL